MGLVLPLTAAADPRMLAGTVPAWLFGSALAARTAFAAASRARARELQAVATRIEGEVAARIESRKTGAKGPAVRVAEEEEELAAPEAARRSSSR
jgi:hypothetical protein